MDYEDLDDAELAAMLVWAKKTSDAFNDWRVARGLEPLEPRRG